MLETLLIALLSALIVSAVSFVGAATFFLSASRLQKAVPFLMSLAAGAMLGNALLHLLPPSLEALNADFVRAAPTDDDHAHHDAHHNHQHGSQQAQVIAGHSHNHAGLVVAAIVLGGFLALYAMDLTLLSIGRSESGAKPLAYLVLFSDGMENFIDGLMIGAAYLVALPVGIATTVAVMIHEVPAELGDFAVLTDSGFSRKKALLVNFLSATINLIGVTLAVLVGSAVTRFAVYAAPFAAGAFIYLAASGLLPQLRGRGGNSFKAASFAMTVLGALFMALILLLE